MNGGVTINQSAAQPARVAGELETRLLFDSSRVLSLVQVVLVATASAFFIKWWALLWLAAMVALICTRAGRRDEAIQVKGGFSGTAAIAFGTLLYALPWAAAWLVGGAEAGFLAGAMMGTQAVFSTSFFSASRANFLANLLPAMLISITAPFVIFDHPIPVLIVLLSVIQSFIGAHMSCANRNEVLQELLRAQSEMEAARDASLAKSQFIATMSHELRTPLNAVIGYAEILEEDLTEEGMQGGAEDAARIHRSARNLLSLINDILDYSKIEAGRMDMHVSEVAIDEMVQDAVQTVAHLTKANNTEVEIEIAPDAVMVGTDATKLRQCVLNLLSNAAKFTENGLISVRAIMEHGADGAMLRIEVADTGCGISEEDAGLLFQPFSQVDGSLTRKKGGTGLGLMITRRLCQMMGGDVSFISAENAGSTFTLRVRDYAHPAPSAEGEGPLVLVIEDEADARDLMRRALSRLPLQTAEAHSAEAGLAAARARIPQLIVLDLYLPDRSGWDVLAELKADEALKHVPVMILSIDDDRARAMSMGACEHLVKPADKDRIAAAIMRFALSDAPHSGPLPKHAIAC